jgi:hypothetical protein
MANLPCKESICHVYMANDGRRAAYDDVAARQVAEIVFVASSAMSTTPSATR